MKRENFTELMRRMVGILWILVMLLAGIRTASAISNSADAQHLHVQLVFPNTQLSANGSNVAGARLAHLLDQRGRLWQAAASGVDSTQGRSSGAFAVSSAHTACLWGHLWISVTRER
jgi:hypothetical protein